MGSEKAAVELECDVGFGLKMKQRTESFPCEKMTTENKPAAHQFPYYHHRRLSSSGGFGSTDGDGGVGSGSGSGGGPFYCTGNKQVACMGDVYDVVGAGSGVTLPTTLHHHFINTDSTSFKSSSSSGNAAAAVRGVPLTAVQLQELERQTLIYNYMGASIPLPSELLSSSSSSSDHVAAPPKSNRLWDMGCTNNGTDQEPWRCRRTDGKKWRCSRDVAPDQKYCERHSHKNKARSRKPVEVQQSHSSAINKNRPNLQTTKPQFLNQTDHHHRVSPYPALVSASPFEQQFRYSDWLVNGGTGSAVASSNQQWQQQQLMQSTLVNDQCSLFLGTKMVSLERALNHGHTERPRDFINAWSTADNHKCSVSSNGKLPLSSLTLSMPGDNRTNEDSENAQMCIGMLESDQENAGGTVRSQSLLNWMNPGSWMSSGSTPGGPLAEALCLGMGMSSTRAVSNPESPHGCNNSTTNSSHGKSPSGDGSHGFNLM